MNIGRNDPCACGSGRKYKQCCLTKAMQSHEGEQRAVWRRLRATLDDYPRHILGFVSEHYGDAIIEAWNAFHSVGPEVPEIDSEDPRIAIVSSWLMHAWSPTPGHTSVANPALHGVVPTRAYLARYAHRLDREVARYLDACTRERFGFFEVTDTANDGTLRMRSLWGGEPRLVFEQAASTQLRRGDVVYGLLVPVHDFWMVDCLAGRVFGAIQHVRLIDRIANMQDRRAASTTTEAVALNKAEDAELRAQYLAFDDELSQPSRITNTDGDDLELQTLYFRIASAATAFERLHHLDIIKTRDELLQDATLDENGALTEVEIVWAKPDNPMHPDWSNTLKGRILIQGDSLMLSVNSAARAQDGRRLIEAALGDDVEYLRTEAGMLDDDPSDFDDAFNGDDIDDAVEYDDEEMDEDEVASLDAREAMATMLRNHYARWPDIPLPALQGKTPLEAVADPIGRAKVAVLVAGMQRELRGSAVVPAEVMATLRARLGL